MPEKRANLKVLFLNIQGLSNKITILESFLSNLNSVKIICLSEHWLCSNGSVFAFPNGYYCASSYSRTKHIRGGSLVFVHNSLQSRACDISHFCSEFHFEGSAVFLDDLDIIAVSIYHSPSGDPGIFLETLDKVLAYLIKWSNYTIVVGGDFNYCFDVTTEKKSVFAFKDLLRQYNFYCLNHNPTRGSNCLDNVFINNRSGQSALSCKVFNFPYSDHNGLLVDLSSITQHNTHGHLLSSINHFKLVLPKKSFDDLSMTLASHDWDMIVSQYKNCDEMGFFKKFFSIIINDISKFKILKKVNQTRPGINKNEWYTLDMAKMKNRLIYLHSISRNNTNMRQSFLNLKKEYRQTIASAKYLHNENFITKSKNRCKAAWKVINSNNCTYNNSKTCINPEVFNKFFIDSVSEVKANIGNPSSSSDELLKKNNISNPPETFQWTNISPDNILEAVKNLNNSDSCDVYSMSNNLLKKIVPHIILPLTFSFNLCLKYSYFPEELKISRICPVFKKGPRNKPDSYRPISIIPVIGKLLEAVVYQQVYTHFETHNLLNPMQFGFRKNKSTFQALERLVRDIIQAFEDKAFAQATLCDLSRAFDCVDMRNLINKLAYYGLGDGPLSFFESYLTDRKQKVCVNNNWSQEAIVKYGVPQGSILGPLLFLISINDLPAAVSATTILYADDATLFNISTSLNELNNLTHNAISAASLWFESNGFLLNKSKTQNILFSLRVTDNYPFQDNLSNNVKFLGVFLDGRLNWDTHIDCISSKLSRVIFLLRRLTLCVHSDYVRTAYFAFFQSILRYGLVVWGNASRVSDVLKLQKKAIRIVSNSHFLEHCKPIFKKLKIQTVINLYLFDLINYIFQNPHLIKPTSDKHSHNTRSKSSVIINFYRLNKTLNSHLVISLKVYNHVLHQVQKYNKRVFLKKFYEWLLENPFYSLDEFFGMKSISF